MSTASRIIVFTSLKLFLHRRRPAKSFVSQTYSKYVSRQLILVWKRFTRATRRRERASKLPAGFEIVRDVAAKRRSIFFG